MRLESPMRKVLNPLKPVLSFLACERASQIAEFAVSVPLLVVFVVGIFDFSGAFNLKQKLAGAAQEGALSAGSQTLSDLDQSNPASVRAVVGVVFNYLTNAKVLANANMGSCKVAGASPSSHTPSSLIWQYTISNCPDSLVVTVDRGKVFDATGGLKVVGSRVVVTYPYRWRFNSVIQLLIPTATYSAITQVTTDSVAPNQI